MCKDIEMRNVNECRCVSALERNSALAELLVGRVTSISGRLPTYVLHIMLNGRLCYISIPSVGRMSNGVSRRRVASSDACRIYCSLIISISITLSFTAAHTISALQMCVRNVIPIR